MVLEIREYIQLRGNNPLDAVITGTHHKASLVADLALKNGSQAAADHYDIGLAGIHGAIASYYDNVSIRAARELGEKLGAHSAQSVLDETKHMGDMS